MNNPVMVDLRKVVDQIRAEISERQNQLSVVLKIIEHHEQHEQCSSGSGVRAVPFPEAEQTPDQQVGPLEAVRQAFDEAPNKRWTPADLTMRLEDLKRRGLLRSTSAKVSNAVHVALKPLQVSDYITKHPKDKVTGVPTYSKKMVSQQDDTSVPIKEPR